MAMAVRGKRGGEKIPEKKIKAGRLANLDLLESRILLSTLVWSDEFNQTAGTSPNGANWNYDLGGGGWGNSELETYTNSTNNVSVINDANALDGKALRITAIKTGANSYTSARIKTKGLQQFTYGHIEARLKIPFGQGIWPAFWMLGSNIDSVGWPNSGEIDIMENIGKEPSTVHGTIHGPGYSGGGGIGAPYTLGGGQKFSDAYHTFAIDWSPNSIKWYVDGNLYQTRTPADLGGKTWVYDHNFFIILNLAVGGQWPGNPDGTSTYPQTYDIDYVRVYQDDPAPPPPPPPPPNYNAFKINFQDGSSAGFSGYLADTGAAYALRANGYTYGWNIDNSANGRNRNNAASPDERYDTLSQMQRTGGATSWDVSVPNGTYSVHIVAGDPGFTDSVYRINVENTLAIVGTPTAAQKWFENTLQVTVTDGRLTISNAAGSSNNKINFIDVTAVNADQTPPTVTNKTPAAGATVQTSSANIDVTFSEQVKNIDASDIVLTGAGAASAVKGAAVNVSGNTWRFPVSGLVNGAVNVSLAGDIADVANNPLATVAWSFNVNIPAVLFAAKINFQDASSAGYAGYLADTGLIYGARGNGYTYGWNIANTANGRNRNSANSADERYDTLIQMQRPGSATSWDIAVPNGTYSVKIVAGDPSYTDSVYKINVENVLAINGTPTAATRWFTNTVTVTVADGKLTVSNAAGSVNNKISFIEITQLS